MPRKQVIAIVNTKPKPKPRKTMKKKGGFIPMAIAAPLLGALGAPLAGLAGKELAKGAEYAVKKVRKALGVGVLRAGDRAMRRGMGTKAVAVHKSARFPRAVKPKH